MTPQLLQVQADGCIAVNPDAGVGVLGEAIAAQWVQAQGWHLLHHRWHCRWGELDWVACERSPSSSSPSSPPSQQLVFIEVKTRSARNWDENGALAITPQKQQKLWQTAELFLSSFPEWSTLPCRFDLILVQHRRSPIRNSNPTHRVNPEYSTDPAHYGIQSPSSQSPSSKTTPSDSRWLTLSPRPLSQSEWIPLGNYRFRVEDHIKHAFDLSP